HGFAAVAPKMIAAQRIRNDQNDVHRARVKRLRCEEAQRASPSADPQGAERRLGRRSDLARRRASANQANGGDEDGSRRDSAHAGGGPAGTHRGAVARRGRADGRVVRPLTSGTRFAGTGSEAASVWRKSDAVRGQLLGAIEGDDRG